MTCHAHALAASRQFLRAADVDLIQDTIRALPKRKTLNVVDLGAGAGTTSLAAFEAGPDVRIWCYDIDIDALNWAEQAVVNIGRRDDWVKCETAKQLDDEIGKKRLDLLMVDHEHSHSAVAAALLWGGSLLKKTGRVWLHDYVGETPGVARAVDEAVREGRFKVEAEAGLGIVLALR